MKKSNFKRVLSCLLLGALALSLCACPAGGGTTCTHTYGEDGVCTLCGVAKPCEHTYAGGVCTKCGAEQNCSHNYENGVCTLCGGADPNYDAAYGNGAAINGAGDTLAAGAAVFTPATYDEGAAVAVPAGNFARAALKKMAAGVVFRAEGGVAKVMATNAQNVTYDGMGGAILVPDGIAFSEADKLTVKNMVIVGNITVGGKEIIFENCKIIGTVTVSASSENAVFNSCRV